jgi:hypothetical protein
MKLLGKQTAIMVGDIATINRKKNTIKIKRGTKALSFERLIISEKEITELGFEEHEELSDGCCGVKISATILFRIILFVTNMTAVKVIGSGNNPDEEYWQIQRYPEDVT